MSFLIDQGLFWFVYLFRPPVFPVPAGGAALWGGAVR